MRKKCDFPVQSCNTSLFQKSVINMGIKLHNKVPNRITKLESFKVLQVELKSFLLDHSFCTLNEFLVLIKVDEIARVKSGNKFVVWLKIIVVDILL
jgi:hypothetical protein